MVRVNILLIMLSLTFSSSGSSADFRHCSLDENVVFSCAVGEKIASICASKDAAIDKGYVQYRFGFLENTEFTYPENKEPANINFSIKYQLASNYIIFKKNLLTYKIISPNHNAGVRFIEVSNSEKLISTLSCSSSPIVSDKDELLAWGFQEISN